MKITESKLREIIRNEIRKLREVSGTAKAMSGAKRKGGASAATKSAEKTYRSSETSYKKAETNLAAASKADKTARDNLLKHRSPKNLDQNRYRYYANPIAKLRGTYSYTNNKGTAKTGVDGGGSNPAYAAWKTQDDKNVAAASKASLEYTVASNDKTTSKTRMDRDKTAWQTKRDADLKAATPPKAGEAGYKPPPTAGAAAAPGAGKGRGKGKGKKGKGKGKDDE